VGIQKIFAHKIQEFCLYLGFSVTLAQLRNVWRNTENIRVKNPRIPFISGIFSAGRAASQRLAELRKYSRKKSKNSVYIWDF